MIVMSLMRPAARQCSQLIKRNGAVPLSKNMQLLGQVSVRNGGGGNKMNILPGRYDWIRFKDDLHFYLMLGLVPMALVVGYANVVVGPAELSEIPEGYEPKEYEYYRTPIKRFLVKYVFEEPQKQYEKTLHFLRLHQEEKYWTALDKKVKTLVSDRQDYKGWYWVDANKSIKDEQFRLLERNRTADSTG